MELWDATVIAMSRYSKQIVASSVGLMMAFAGGCVVDSDTESFLGGAVYLPALMDEPEAGPYRPAPAADEASLTSIDRENWSTKGVLVPSIEFEHYPIFTTRHSIMARSARQRGEFPTTESALDLAGGSEQDQTTEGFTTMFYAWADVVLFIPRMFVHAPSITVEGPRQGYGRQADTTLALTSSAPDGAESEDHQE